MNTSALTYITIFLTSILGLFLAFVSFSFAKLIRKYYKLKEDKENLEKNYEAEAERIVQEARDKALQIVKESTAVSQEAKEEITTALRNVSQSQISEFKSLQNDIKDQILESFKLTTDQFQQSAKSEIEKFQSNLQQQTASSQGFLEKAIQDALGGIQKEIDEYKTSRLEGAKESIFQIIKLATKNFLGDVINPADHEELVIASLEKAKEQNLFAEVADKKESLSEKTEGTESN
ncbi:hypothetical protein JXA63_00425 [Candidatus Woesebacteria bacterium]|nr:hypothetical protein [Candidatus Woesebacteria bacterium]